MKRLYYNKLVGLLKDFIQEDNWDKKSTSRTTSIFDSLNKFQVFGRSPSPP